MATPQRNAARRVNSDSQRMSDERGEAMKGWGPEDWAMLLIAVGIAGALVVLAYGEAVASCG